MHEDRYGLGLSTASSKAAEAYVSAVDLFLAADPEAGSAFDRAIEADPEFALAHAGRARVHQLRAAPAAARAAMARAEHFADGATPRERSHVAMLALLVAGRPARALAAAREHLSTSQRDAMVLAPCTGTFGLIAFSGARAHEAELAALLDGLSGAYGDDWWFLGARAFALCESGRLRDARPMLEHALARHPRNANAAHFYAHLLYEEGRRDEGLAFLESWLPSYPRAGMLHCHLSWHRALWLHDAGRKDEAWQVYRSDVRPGAAWGPPLNALSDAASFLWRAELDGHARDREEWRHIAAYVPAVASGPGLAFADMHALLAFAAAGDDESLARWQAGVRDLLSQGALPAGDIVQALGHAWRASANADWGEAARTLEPLIADHSRVGGSRAQRDLIEQTFVVAATRSGRARGDALAVVRERVRTRYAEVRATIGVAWSPAR